MANSNEIKDKFLLASGDIVDYSHERNAVKLSKIEETYYAAIDKAERVKAYRSNLFKKLSEFQPGEIYKYKDNKGKYYIKIIEKVEAKGELHIKYLTQDGEAHYKPASFFTEIPRKPKKIPTFPAANNRAARQPSIGISKGTEPVKAGYYIITDANCKEIGSIILIFNGATKMLNTDQNITETYKINQLKEIDRDEAFYLSKFPTNQSIEKWKGETFKQIKALRAGNDDCRYTKDMANIYHVKSKYITEKGIRFIIQRKESAGISRDADASEIELIQMFYTNYSNNRRSFYLHGHFLHSQVLNAIDSINGAYRRKLRKVLFEFINANTISRREQKSIKEQFYDIENYIEQQFYNVDVYLYGSHVTGLAHIDSDLDITILFHNRKSIEDLNNIKQKRMLKRIENYFIQLNKFSEIEGVYSARIPIIRCKTERNLRVDISASNTIAIDNTEIIREYSIMDSRVSILGRLLKQVVNLYEIGDAHLGTLSSFGYALMLIHFLQKRNVLPILPDRHRYSENKRPRPKDNCKMWHQSSITDLDYVWICKLTGLSISELWIGFFEYYTLEFDFEVEVVSIRQKQPLLKSTKNWIHKVMVIEDPSNITNAIGSNIRRSNYQKILDSFCEVLLARGDINQISTKIRNQKSKSFYN